MKTLKTKKGNDITINPEQIVSIEDFSMRNEKLCEIIMSNNKIYHVEMTCDELKNKLKK